MAPSLTPRRRFIDALERRPPAGRVPHFELVFFLTMEAFGKLHPLHRRFDQWDQMTKKERRLHRRDIAQVHIDTARTYEHDAIFIHGIPPGENEDLKIIDVFRDMIGDEFFLMIHGDPTYEIPAGDAMTDFCTWLHENPDRAHAKAQQRVQEYLETGERLARHGGLDGFALCSDYCFNTGPFFSPGWFDRFVTPYLTDVIAGYRDLGFYTIKHTDGNIMLILDRLVEAKPHALHSLDPQGGVDIAEVKRLVGDRVCLCGNVNCAVLDTGTDQQCIDSARYALRHGMPGGGYIFSTSNCIYTGMPLERYELILDIWRREGNYPTDES